MVSKKSRDLFIVHFSPVEKYPPVMNLIHYLERKKAELKLQIYTTRKKGSSDLFCVNEDNSVKIKRRGISDENLPRIRLLITYIYFNFSVLIGLITRKPNAVMYFETLSSFPVLIYKKLFNSKINILVHYHEYVSPEEHQKGMMQLRIFHRMEQVMYSQMSWISQTNSKRLELFLRDNRLAKDQKMHVLPNYPPQKWSEIATVSDKLVEKEKRFVLIGSISLNTMYTKEFAHWIKAMNGLATWDIYSFNISSEVSEFFTNLNCPSIRLFGPVNYFDLPSILKNYDIGLILYKGYSPNVTFSVSNKLFEYHVSGLDVWFSHEIVGSNEFVTKANFPQILRIDFTNLNNFNLESITDRSNKLFKIWQFSYEKALEPWYDHLLKYFSTV